jgi:ABC-type dipeptide/oligopeptide/nickel transport system permease subunit
MGAGILTEAALGFLGFGIRSPDISLGQLVSQYAGAFSTRPWLFVWPGIFIVGIVLCLQFIGDGLRDAFDPRQKRIPKRKDLESSKRTTVPEPAGVTA